MRTLAVILAVSAAVALSCAPPPILTPTAGPGTDYPCGVHGIECAHDKGMCCNEGEVCGGDDPTCPADSCCFVSSAYDLMGARRPHPKFRAR